CNEINVWSDDVEVIENPFCVRKFPGFHNAGELFDFIAGDGVKSVADFETVILRWIVAGRDHHSAFTAKAPDSEVENRRGADPYIYYVHAGLKQPADQQIAEPVRT